MAVNKQRELKVEGERVKYVASDNLVERFDAAVKKDGIYSNRSDAVRGLMIEYINKVGGNNAVKCEIIGKKDINSLKKHLKTINELDMPESYKIAMKEAAIKAFEEDCID